ncbi:MAG TPA: lipoyl(octanoyl) transferase LipB [Nitrospirales bacterium]|nr:lipoyl(octanoyl) transferase [Nitrospiraceae bacterium]HNP29009.1 lipoyl(octanoyl) transferase LipB [Nitrospirales bacterium]
MALSDSRQPGMVLTFPHLPYAEAWELQQSLATQRLEGHRPDTLVLTEHEPVITLGRTTKSEHWKPRWPELRDKGVHLHQTGRGGSVTYHGPGQLIGYPILRLRNFCPGPKIYVQQLEEVLIRTLEEWGIVGCRHETFRGVWVRKSTTGMGKIASIGVRISRGVTMHGFALNVNVDLQPFTLLAPCGIEHCVMTSMEKLLNKPVNDAHVREQVATHFADVFRLKWTEQKWV